MKMRHLWRSLTMTGRIQSELLDIAGHIRNLFADDGYARAYRTVRPYTMSGNARLRGLYQAVIDVSRRSVPGDIVECGTARGGSAALLGLAARDSGRKRLTWVFDTFAGIPAPTVDDPDYHVAAHYTGQFRGDLGEVSNLLGRLGILDDCRLVRGLFQDTLPEAPVTSIAVLHIDGDWYDSVKVCLEHLYDRVSPGGIIQVDDYGHWEGARKAVDEFLRSRGLSPALQRLDYTGRQFVKA